MGGKDCLKCKGKTKKFVDNAQQCFVLLPQVNFPANNLNFHWRWWYWIRSIFLNLFYFMKVWIQFLLIPLWYSNTRWMTLFNKVHSIGNSALNTKDHKWYIWTSFEKMKILYLNSSNVCFCHGEVFTSFLLYNSFYVVPIITVKSSFQNDEKPF